MLKCQLKTLLHQVSLIEIKHVFVRDALAKIGNNNSENQQYVKS